MMNTRDFEYFVQLVDLKSFSAVAKVFRVSQPTVSLSLKRLEEQYGIELIHRDRSHNTLTVTAAGEQLATHARSILSELRQTQQDLDALQVTTVRLGLPPIIGNYYFPKLIPHLVNNGSMDHLQTIEGGSGNLLKRLRAGELDMALLGSVGPLVADDLQVEQLFARPFAIIAAPQRKVGQDGAVAFAQLVGEPFVALGEQYVHAQAFRALNHSAGLRQRVVFRSDDVSLIKTMVHQDVGIALLTDLAVTPEDHLQLIRLTDPGQPLFTVSLVRRQNQLTTPMQRKVMRALIQAE